MLRTSSDLANCSAAAVRSSNESAKGSTLAVLDRIEAAIWAVAAELAARREEREGHL